MLCVEKMDPTKKKTPKKTKKKKNNNNKGMRDFFKSKSKKRKSPGGGPQQNNPRQPKVNKKDTDLFLDELENEEKAVVPPVAAVPPSLEVYGFSPQYAANMAKIRRVHRDLCKKLTIQARHKSLGFRFMNKLGLYFRGSSTRPRAIFDSDGKKISLPCPRYGCKRESNSVKKRKNVYVCKAGHEWTTTPENPLRLSFFNGGKAHFDYSHWRKIHQARAIDIHKEIILFDNEFVYDKEGCKLFLELDYRSKDRAPTEVELIQHALECQKTVKRLFDSNPHVDFGFWVLLSEPKPKIVKDCPHPVIAMGMHLVFEDIVVNMAQGAQICLSANLALEAKFGKRELVDNCYKQSITSLRPIYCRKLDVCQECMGDDEMRISCENCVCRGKTPSTSIYVPSYKMNTGGRDEYEGDFGAFQDYCKNNLVDVVRRTSIVPAEIGKFTQGWVVPNEEVRPVPFSERSQHKDDRNKNWVSRTDRRKISTRKQRAMADVTDNGVLDAICKTIKAYHPAYNKDSMFLGRVQRSKTTVFVDLRGSGRNFCRVCNVSGHTHSSNRIFFAISRPNMTVRQHCYKHECNEMTKATPAIASRLKKKIPPTLVAKIFPSKKKTNATKAKKKSQTKKGGFQRDDDGEGEEDDGNEDERHENMNSFLSKFGA